MPRRYIFILYLVIAKAVKPSHNKRIIKKFFLYIILFIIIILLSRKSLSYRQKNHNGFRKKLIGVKENVLSKLEANHY